MHHVLERPPLWPSKRPQRAIGRVAERHEVRAEAIPREAEDIPREILVLYGGMPGAGGPAAMGSNNAGIAGVNDDLLEAS